MPFEKPVADRGRRECSPARIRYVGILPHPNFRQLLLNALVLSVDDCFQPGQCATLIKMLVTLRRPNEGQEVATTLQRNSRQITRVPKNLESSILGAGKNIDQSGEQVFRFGARSLCGQ